MADVDTRPKMRRATCSPRPPAKVSMYRMIVAKVRLSAAELKQYQLAAGKRTLSAFIRESVEAAIIGKVDQARLNEHLIAIRKTINAASEAATIEETRMILAIAKLHVNELGASNGAGLDHQNVVRWHNERNLQIPVIIHQFGIHSQVAEGEELGSNLLRANQQAMRNNSIDQGTSLLLGR